ncbi:MAG: hypothetical protein MJE68_22295 [Proteobacteria bacterium]|nr:hypothetical protein [Pseudomonadota bacterium]
MVDLPPPHTTTTYTTYTHTDTQYSQLVGKGLIVPQPEVEPSTVPIDYIQVDPGAGTDQHTVPAAFLSSVYD